LNLPPWFLGEEKGIGLGELNECQTFLLSTDILTLSSSKNCGGTYLKQPRKEEKSNG
jgi:hypothetical protein